MDGNEDSGSDDSGQINDISGYGKPIDVASDNSDTLPSAKRQNTRPYYVEDGENSSCSTPQSRENRPKPRGMKSLSKKATKTKSPLSEATEVISTTMKQLRKSFVEHLLLLHMNISLYYNRGCSCFCTY